MLGDNGAVIGFLFLGPIPLAVSRQGFYMMISMGVRVLFFARSEHAVSNDLSPKAEFG